VFDSVLSPIQRMPQKAPDVRSDLCVFGVLGASRADHGQSFHNPVREGLPTIRKVAAV
jgi:hypothetical protein